MLVHLRFLVWAIVDVHHLYVFILESQLVVFGLDLERILR
jgi:hypothetical protein